MNNEIITNGNNNVVYEGWLGSNSSMVNILGVLIPIKIVLGIYLFAKGKLPYGVAKYVGRIYYMMVSPFIMAMQIGGFREPLVSKLDDSVFLGGMPFSWDVEMTLVSKFQIGAIVNLCDEYEGPISKYNQFSIQQLYVPIVDHYEPDVETIVKSIQFINNQISKGNRVFIHCKAGRGRSGAIAICWIAHSQRISLEEAQKLLLEKRKIVRKQLYKQKNVQQYYFKYCNTSSNFQ